VVVESKQLSDSRAQTALKLAPAPMQHFLGRFATKKVLRSETLKRSIFINIYPFTVRLGV
jgi:hypothetical protein